jgi:hypothetical protein
MNDLDVSIIIPGLSNPTSDGTHVPTIENFNTFGFIMLVVQIGLALFGLLLSEFTEAYFATFFISLIMGSFFCILVWVCTLPKGCKDWLTDISLLILPFAALIGILLDQPSNVYFENMDPEGGAFLELLYALAGLFFVLLQRCVLVYSKKALRQEYEPAGSSSEHSQSVHLGSRGSVGIRPTTLRIIYNMFQMGLMPTVFLTALATQAASDAFRASDEYINHNPYCVSGQSVSSINNNINSEGCVIAPSNFSSIPVFINGTDFYTTESAGFVADNYINSDNINLIGTNETNQTRFLTVHDFARLMAKKEFDENMGLVFTAIAGGLVLNATLLAAQIYLRVSRFSLADVVRGHVSCWETFAALMNVVLVIYAILGAALDGDTIGSHTFLLVAFGMVCFCTLYVSLGMVCREASMRRAEHDQEKSHCCFVRRGHGKRPRRPSAILANPQAINGFSDGAIENASVGQLSATFAAGSEGIDVECPSSVSCHVPASRNKKVGSTDKNPSRHSNGRRRHSTEDPPAG